MNLIEKWKSRETKRSLREENIALRAENERLNKDIRMMMDYPPNVCTIDRNVQRAVARKVLPHEVYARYPEEQIKYELRRMLINQVTPFVEYDFYSDKEMGHVYTATLYVATGDRRTT